MAAVSEAKHKGEAAWPIVIGAVLIAGAVGYIVVSSMDSAIYSFHVHDVVGQEQLVGEEMRIRGVVVDESHRRRQGTLDEHIFLLTTNQQVITVTFKGALPDQFADGASVVANGVLLDGETFAADTITAQCPSRYEEEAPTEEATPTEGVVNPDS